MWEFTKGEQPFQEFGELFLHGGELKVIKNKVLKGERPKITNDTPEVFAELMKKCWNQNQKERPEIVEIKSQFDKWCLDNEDETQFIEAERRRRKLLDPPINPPINPSINPSIDEGNSTKSLLIINPFLIYAS
ncbi:kinase-like protein [Gigaspora margarita]|uniref:Kinase-like protein n=1 Tax=Gigaspora margarita TaxID=4874 RepID=A0A8H4ELQ7_GIGMA|nr:kinase-like protein [Gigaspora margarita]